MAPQTATPEERQAIEAVSMQGPFASQRAALDALSQELFARSVGAPLDRVEFLLSQAGLPFGKIIAFNASEDSGGDGADDSGGGTTDTGRIIPSDLPRIGTPSFNFAGSSEVSGPFRFDEAFRRSIFTEEPSFAFQTALTGADRPKRETEFFRRRAGDFLGRFEGALGQELERFGTTTLNPLDFFQGIDFGQEFGQLSPRARGETPSLFNPRTRSIFF